MLDRSSGQRTITLPALPSRDAASPVRLDILVQAMGRQNFGCGGGGWDLKGLQSERIQLGKQR